MLRFVLVVGLLSLLATGAAHGEILIKFSHVVAEDAPKGQAAIMFRDRVHQRLAGRARVEVYPNSTLYNDTAVLKALLLGDVQMAAPAMSKLGRYTDKYGVFDLPFLFDDTDAVRCFFRGPAGKKLLGAMEHAGLKGLDYWLHGMKQISANGPIRRPADVAGKSFRIMDSDVLERQFELLGAIPKRIPLFQVHGSLRAGLVVGHENTWSNIYTQRLHEVRPHITETNHGALEYLVVTSTAFWDSLPDDIRLELEQILNEVSEEVADIAVRQAAMYRELVVENEKTEVITLTPTELAEWRAALMPLWAQFQDKLGADVIAAARACNR